MPIHLVVPTGISDSCVLHLQKDRKTLVGLSRLLLLICLAGAASVGRYSSKKCGELVMLYPTSVASSAAIMVHSLFLCSKSVKKSQCFVRLHLHEIVFRREVD
jgi:hypothetical protein